MESGEFTLFNIKRSKMEKLAKYSNFKLNSHSSTLTSKSAYQLTVCLMVFYKAIKYIPVILVCLFMSACGLKYNVTGKVVDGETGKPVEGAAIAINWTHVMLGFPGLPVPRKDLGTTQTLTDADGSFTVPAYIYRDHFMGVYKKGYICWSSETEFNPHGDTDEEVFIRRPKQKACDGMIIYLNPMPQIRLEKHACFTDSVVCRLWTTGNGPFDRAVRHEEETCIQFLRKKSWEQ